LRGQIDVFLIAQILRSGHLSFSRSEALPPQPND
jgi:hypothetical protein